MNPLLAEFGLQLLARFIAGLFTPEARDEIEEYDDEDFDYDLSADYAELAYDYEALVLELGETRAELAKVIGERDKLRGDLAWNVPFGG